MASAVPDHLELGRHRDFDDRTLEEWTPRVLFGLACVLPILALIGVFGQSPDVQTVANPNGAATMTLSAPTTVRSGLLWQARFDINAKREIKDAVLVLDSGWLESMKMNTSKASPADE